MRCPDCGVVSTPDDNYCECPPPPICAECKEDMNAPTEFCWEHIEDFSTLREYCRQREKDAKEKSIRMQKYIRDLEDVKKDLYKIIAREGKV